MYITFAEYQALYNDLEETQFNIYAYEASRLVDIYTSGVDGVLKLKDYMPTEDYDVKAIKHCTAKITHELYMFDKAKNASGYVEREDGTIMGKTVSRVSSGSESVHYEITKSVYETSNETDKSMYLRQIIDGNLRNVCDKNGVNVLYMGRYPNV